MLAYTAYATKLANLVFLLHAVGRFLSDSIVLKINFDHLTCDFAFIS